MKLSNLRVDPARETEGVWVTFPGSDFELKIARLGNPAYEAALAAARRDLSPADRREIGAGVNSERARSLMAPIVASTIVRDWRGLEDDAGDPIHFSAGECREMLEQEAFKDLFAFILGVASEGELYRGERVEEAAGN